MKRTFFVPYLMIFLLTCSEISGSCGSASCPLHSRNFMSKGSLFLRITHEYIHQNEIYTGSSRSFVGAIPQHHDEVSTLNQITSLSSVYGISDFLSLNLILPFIHREHTHIHNHNGEKIPDRWNFSGLGDAVLLADFSLLNDMDITPVVNILAGIKLPTGITDFKNNEGSGAEVPLQPGSGSVDYIMGFTITQNIFSVPTLGGTAYSAVPLIFNINYKLNTKGTDDYKSGNELHVHLSTAYRIIKSASLLMQINGRFQSKADAGNTNEPGENTGGKWIFVSPGLKFHFSEELSLYSYFQLPVYQNVNGIQQSAPYNLQFGIQQEISF